MKRIVILTIYSMLAIASSAQVIFDMGLKGGVNFSKVSLDLEDYNEDAITKMHIGAFGRVGWKKVYVQPEVYFTKKGGEFSSNVISLAGDFDYSAVDVPVLFGVRLLDAKVLDLHLIAGPVLGFVTKSSVKGNPEFDESYFKDHYLGLQYGAGVDVLFLTVDLRVEHGNTVYEHPDFDGKNTTFMVTVGFKIL